MKRQLERLKGKRLVTGDANLMTKNEICINTTSDGGVEVKEIGVDGKIKDLDGSGGANKNPFTEYLYFKFANVISEELHTDVVDYLFNLRLLTFDKISQTRVDLDNITTIDILHCIYKIKDNNANGTAIYLNDLVKDIGSGFMPSWEYMEQGYAEISIAIPKYTMNLVFGSGGAYIGDSLNVFVDTLELLKSLTGVNYKELLKYQITEEEFWKEATITNISTE